MNLSPETERALSGVEPVHPPTPLEGEIQRVQAALRLLLEEIEQARADLAQAQQALEGLIPMRVEIGRAHV